MRPFPRLPVPIRLAARLVVGLVAVGAAAGATTATSNRVAYAVVRGYTGDGSDDRAPRVRVSVPWPVPTPGPIASPPPSAAPAVQAPPVSKVKVSGSAIASRPPSHTPAPAPAKPPPPPVTPPPAPGPTPPPGSPGSDATPPSGPPPAQSVVKQIITAAAQRHGVDPNWMLRIAQCESGFNAYAQNPRGPYDGLFQFLPSTFHAHGGTNIWDASQQAEITATMLANGQGWAWSCA